MGNIPNYVFRSFAARSEAHGELLEPGLKVIFDRLDLGVADHVSWALRARHALLCRLERVDVADNLCEDKHELRVRIARREDR